MSESIFDPKLLYLAMQKSGMDMTPKSAFVDQATMQGGGGGQPPAGGDPSQGGAAAGGAPPQDPAAAAGGAPPAPPAGGAAPPTDPMSQTLDPAAAGPGQDLATRIAALEAGGGGAGKPKGGGANEKAEQMMMMKQMVNMMSILFTHMNIPVPPQVMIPESASGIAAGSPQVQQVAQDAQAQQGGDQQQQGPGSVLGDVGGPPQPVSPMSSVLGGGGGVGGDPGKSAADQSLKFAGFSGIAVTPDMLNNLVREEMPSKNGSQKKPAGPDARRILGLRR